MTPYSEKAKYNRPASAINSAIQLLNS